MGQVMQGVSAASAAPIPNSYWLPAGRVLAGEYPGDRSEDAARAKLGSLLDAGVRAFVDLTAPADRMDPYEPLLRAEAAARQAVVTYRSLPVTDMDVPGPRGMARILDAIDAEVEAGRVVYIHCWGGVGRTGTVAGCYLVRGGLTGPEALDAVARGFATVSAEKRRRHPGGAPQTGPQRDMVLHWREARPIDPGRRRFPIPAMGRYARGCLLGGAVGDALGAAVEFDSLDVIRSRYGVIGIEEMDIAYGRVGAITDDTQMALFTAEGVLRSTTRAVERTASGDPAWDGAHRRDPDVMWGAYQRWLRTQDPRSPEPPCLDGAPGWLVGLPALHARRAPGSTCLSALYSGRPGSVAAPPNRSKGCGGVMRVAPVGLVRVEGDDPFAYAAEAAALTHGHPSGYLAAGALAVIIHEVALRRTALEPAVAAALERLRGEPDHQATTAALEGALAAYRRGMPSAEAVEGLGAGWVAEEALAIAVYSALAAEGDFAAGVRLAANHSGDSDSTGAIAGNILGALLGAEAIPARWLDALELRGAIEALADDLVAGYRPGDAWRARYPGC